MHEPGKDIDPKTGQFLKGKKGGPGRPKGSRNTLGEKFLTDLQADWQEHGVDAIKACRQEKPTEYVKVVAGLLPKQIEVKKPEQELTDGELADLIDALQSQLAVAGGSEPTHDGTGTAQ